MFVHARLSGNIFWLNYYLQVSGLHPRIKYDFITGPQNREKHCRASELNIACHGKINFQKRNPGPESENSRMYFIYEPQNPINPHTRKQSMQWNSIKSWTNSWILRKPFILIRGHKFRLGVFFLDNTLQQIVKYETGQPIKYNLFIKILQLEKYSLETKKNY